MKKLIYFFLLILGLGVIHLPTLTAQNSAEEQLEIESFIGNELNEQHDDFQKLFPFLSQLNQNRSLQSLGNPPPTIQLDSMVIDRFQPQTGGYKKSIVRTLQYDQQFNISEMNDYTINDITNALELSEERTFSYDPSGNINIFQTTSEYVAGVFTRGSRTTVTYSNNLAMGNVLEIYDSTQTWMFFRKLENMYDQNDNLTEITWSEWKNGAWEPSFSINYTYNSMSQLILRVESDYINGAWEPNAKWDITIDINGNATEFKRSNYVNGAWEFNFRDVHTYDINGNRIQSVGSSYSNGTWDLSRQTINTYTSSGNIEKKEEFNYLNATWIPTYKRAYSYDAQESNLEYLYTRWDSNTQLWDTLQERIFTYDNSVPYVDLLIPAYPFAYSFTEFQFKTQLLTADERRFDYGLDLFLPYDKKRFYYSPIVMSSNEKEVPENTITVFPNPTNNVLSFDLPKSASPPTVCLYHMNGKLILEPKQLIDGTLELPDLPTAVYAYLLVVDGKRYIGKVMIE